jgi:hypothetical protein
LNSKIAKRQKVRELLMAEGSNSLSKSTKVINTYIIMTRGM